MLPPSGVGGQSSYSNFLFHNSCKLLIFSKFRRKCFVISTFFVPLPRFNYKGNNMSKFSEYNVILKDLTAESRILEFSLDDVFFKKIDSPEQEVQKGKIKAIVTVQKKLKTFELQFVLDGIIMIQCDRCLDEMEQQIHYKEKLQVKFGDRFSEENEIVIIPESEGSINIAWFLYEFIVLNIPLKHVHAPGECNKTMVIKMKRHVSHQKDDMDDGTAIDIDDEGDFPVDDNSIDPRWENLQNILDNN